MDEDTPRRRAGSGTVGMGKRRLGWIKPDDGVREKGRFLDYECFGLDGWLTRHGVGGIRPIVATSKAEALHTPEDLLLTGSVDRLLEPGRTLAARGCDAVCWVCTSGSFVGGLDWARAQTQTLGSAIGVPFTSTSLAILDALGALRVAEVDVLSPYPDALTQRLLGFLQAGGVRPGVVKILSCPTGSASHRLDLRRELTSFTTEHRDRSAPVLIPDAAVNTLNLVAELERIAGRVVVTANQATLWKAFRLLELDVTVKGAGTLLKSEKHI